MPHTSPPLRMGHIIRGPRTKGKYMEPDKKIIKNFKTATAEH